MFGLLSSLTNLNDWFSCQTSSLQTILLLADSYRTTEQPTAPTEYLIIYEMSPSDSISLHKIQ